MATAVLAAAAVSHPVFFRNDRSAIIVYCTTLVGATIASMRLPQSATLWLLATDRDSLSAGRLALIAGTLGAVVMSLVAAF